MSALVPIFLKRKGHIKTNGYFKKKKKNSASKTKFGGEHEIVNNFESF